MNTVLEAIKLYPDCFIQTLEGRASTTPSLTNKHNHLLMIELIKSCYWNKIGEAIQRVEYKRPFEGVVFCLSHYSNIDNDVWHEIVSIYEQGKLVEGDSL